MPGCNRSRTRRDAAVTKAPNRASMAAAASPTARPCTTRSRSSSTRPSATGAGRPIRSWRRTFARPWNCNWSGRGNVLTRTMTACTKATSTRCRPTRSGTTAAAAWKSRPTPIMATWPPATWPGGPATPRPQRGIKRRAEKSAAPSRNVLWLNDRGHFGSYVEQGGHRRVHGDAWVYSEFLPIDAGMATPEQALAIAVLHRMGAGAHPLALRRPVVPALELGALEVVGTRHVRRRHVAPGPGLFPDGLGRRGLGAAAGRHARDGLCRGRAGRIQPRRRGHRLRRLQRHVRPAPWSRACSATIRIIPTAWFTCVRRFRHPGPRHRSARRITRSATRRATWPATG